MKRWPTIPVAPKMPMLYLVCMGKDDYFTYSSTMRVGASLAEGKVRDCRRMALHGNLLCLCSQLFLHRDQSVFSRRQALYFIFSFVTGNGKKWVVDNVQERLHPGMVIAAHRNHRAGDVKDMLLRPIPVSYTHLTLPTIYS